MPRSCPGFDEVSSDFTIFIGGIEASGRMIVSDDDRGGVVEDGAAGDFARMDEAAVYDPDADDPNRDEVVRAVERQLAFSPTGYHLLYADLTNKLFFIDPQAYLIRFAPVSGYSDRDME